MRQASVPVLDNFFHWLLEERRERLHKASSLQTYWNAWTMIRQQKTTLTVEPQLKAAMDGVCINGTPSSQVRLTLRSHRSGSS
jgi:hypothetical protein